jgi:hypothetical protein
MAQGINRALGAGLVVFLAGVARDQQWHATHDTQNQFETASKQAEVHWLLWLGVLILLVATWMARRRPGLAGRNRGYGLTFASALVFAGVSVWHFIEHANGNDPQLAHLLLYGSGFAIVAGGVLALLDARRGQASQPPDPVSNATGTGP